MFYPTKRQSGFTLIELLVVIAIIGILAAVVLASLNTARDHAKNTRRVSDVKELQKAMYSHMAVNGDFPKINGTRCIGLNDGQTCWGDQNRQGSTALTQMLQPYLPTFPTDPDPARGWGDRYMYLDGFINLNCTATVLSGKFILYRPQTIPTSQNDCPIGYYGCCGSGGPCGNLGGYYCALKLE